MISNEFNDEIEKIMISFTKFIMTLVLPFSPTTEITSYPLCKNCHHMILNEQQCKLYGHVNVINGECSYLSCSVVRKKQEMCGYDGKFFTRYIPFNFTKNFNNKYR